MKVARITLGGPPACLVLPAPRDAGMGWRESAEAIRAALTKLRRAKPAKSGKGAMSPLGLDSCPERELATKAVRAGSPDSGRSVYRPTGERSAERKLGPVTGGRNRRIRDPYVRWCGRSAGATSPPTRFRISCGLSNQRDIWIQPGNFFTKHSVFFNTSVIREVDTSDD